MFLLMSSVKTTYLAREYKIQGTRSIECLSRALGLEQDIYQLEVCFFMSRYKQVAKQETKTFRIKLTIVL